MTAIEEMFPAFQLRLHCGPVTLRAVRESDVATIVELASEGIHAADARPFLLAWNLAPAGDLPTNTLQHYWSLWSTFSRDDWNLPLAVERDGELVGVQNLIGHDFATTRVGNSGSWLGLRHHGRGTGTLMRQMIVAFAFDELGAVEMRSGAWHDNPASRRVSAKVGYVDNGHAIRSREGEATREDQFVVTPHTFRRPGHALQVHGADAFRRAIGLE